MKIEGYWCYIITAPDGMKYVGRSGASHTRNRWRINLYHKTSLFPYIFMYGWDNLEKLFIDGLTKDESFRLEDTLIRMYKEKGCCINKFNSGGLRCDGKTHEYYVHNRLERLEHQKEYYRQHREERKAYQRRYNRKKRMKGQSEEMYYFGPLW